jgi:hypothetical protein
VHLLVIVYHLALEEFKSLGDCTVVCVPLGDVTKPSSQVGSHQAYRAVKQVESDSDTTFVSAQTRKTGLAVSMW